MRRTSILLMVLFVLLPSQFPASVWPRPAALASDPAFWEMLTPGARRVVSGLTYVVANKPCDFGANAYTGGIYQNGTIWLCGIRARTDRDILRHEILHALDAAAAHPCLAVKNIPAHLFWEAQGLYGSLLTEGELYAMLPIAVGWHLERLPQGVRSCYAQWFGGLR